MLKDHRVEEKQSFKFLSVYIPVKYIIERNLIESYSVLKKLFIPFNVFAQIRFLVDCSVHFICRRYFYPYFYPVVKRNKKIFTLFYFITFEVTKIKNVLKLRKLLYFGSSKRSIPFLSKPEYTPTKKNLSQDISPGPIQFVIFNP